MLSGRGYVRRWAFVLVIAVAGCSEEKKSGSIEMQIIRPTGRRCEYVIDYAPVRTLESITEMRGLMGQVVTTGDNVESRPEILDQGIGFQSVDVQFSESGSGYSPLDYNSLYAASLYYSIEQGHLLFSQLDPAADLTRLVNMRDTKIVHEARRSFGDVGTSAEVFDNAEFLAHRRTNTPQAPVVNYFFSFPTEEVQDIPLGLNLGIMVHEFSHMVSHHLFYEPAFRTNLLVREDGKPTANTLAALDEGIADYFGFLATKDPAYFDCSYPNSGRDLSQPKSFTPQMRQEMAEENFDPHLSGAVFAAISYEIGKSAGFEEQGRSIIRLMQQLNSCASSGQNAISVDWAVVARCHLQVIDGRYQTYARQVYNTYLGPYGGAQ